jgi:hypothetical protein
MTKSAAFGVLSATITALVVRPAAALPAAFVFLAVAVLHVHRVRTAQPTLRWLTAASVPVVLVLHAIAAARIGEPERFWLAVAGAAVAVLAVLAVHVTSSGLEPDELAFAALIGSTLGWFGLARVGLGLGLGLVIGAIAVGPLVHASRRRAEAGILARPSTTVAPALATGAWIALCWGDTFFAYGVPAS